MNERIRELYTSVVGNDKLNFDSYLAEKFAELIVRECAKAVEYSIWHLPRGYKAVDQATFVKKHFGIQ